MYLIKPYDLSQSFRVIPNREKYQLTICHNNSLSFRSKRQAFDFISKISQFYTEVLQMTELIQLSINSYRYHITPSSRANTDKYNIFINNDAEINKLISELKHYRNASKELYQLNLQYTSLIQYLQENVQILATKIPTSVTHITILIQKLANSYTAVITNAEYFYSRKSLSIFIN